MPVVMLDLDQIVPDDYQVTYRGVVYEVGTAKVRDVLRFQKMALDMDKMKDQSAKADMGVEMIELLCPELAAVPMPINATLELVRFMQKIIMGVAASEGKEEGEGEGPKNA